MEAEDLNVEYGIERRARIMPGTAHSEWRIEVSETYPTYDMALRNIGTLFKLGINARIVKRYVSDWEGT